MKTKKLDRRIEYTKMMLRKSLLRLLAIKPLNSISITELCREADVNRSTFYLYYSGAYDLLTEVQEEFYDSIKEDIRNIINSNANDTQLQQLVNKMYINKELCTILFTNASGRAYLEKILELSKSEMLKASLIKDARDRDNHYFIKFLLSGFLGILEEWISHGCKETPKEISTLMTRISVTVK